MWENGVIRRNAIALIIHITCLFKFIYFITNRKEWSCGNHGDDVGVAQNGRKITQKISY